MRSRAVFLPTPGDAFMLHYWLENYKKWRHHVDKLYVCINTPIGGEAKQYMLDLCAQYDAKVIYYDTQQQHGDCLNYCLSVCTEDLVLLVEDDAYVVKPDIIDYCFTQIENGTVDLIGGKRGSCAMEILQKAAEVWGIGYEGYGDQGCNFWPCWLFTKRELLEKTDRNFNAKAWEAGDTVLGINLVPDKTIYGDTFVNTSLQLRALIPADRIRTLPQYHAGQIDISEYDSKRGLFDGNCPWVHIGSLSSGICGVITDGQNRPIAYSNTIPPKTENALNPAWCTNEMEQMEWARRVAFWLRYYDTREVGKLDNLAQLYYNGLMHILATYKINIKKVRQMQAVYASINLWGY